jgi:hypothetical protein
MSELNQKSKQATKRAIENNTTRIRSKHNTVAAIEEKKKKQYRHKYTNEMC